MDSAAQALSRVDFLFVAYPPGYHNHRRDVKSENELNPTREEMDSAAQALFRVDFPFVAYPPEFARHPRSVVCSARSRAGA